GPLQAGPGRVQGAGALPDHGARGPASYGDRQGSEVPAAGASHPRIRRAPRLIPSRGQSRTTAPTGSYTGETYRGEVTGTVIGCAVPSRATVSRTAAGAAVAD